MNREQQEPDYTSDITDNVDAQIAGTGGVADNITDPALGGDPTESDLTAGGTGTAIAGDPDVGGASGAGGGVLDRIGGITTTGGTSDGTVGGSITGSGIPPKPEPPDNGAP